MFIYFRLFPPSKEMKFCPFNFFTLFPSFRLLAIALIELLKKLLHSRYTHRTFTKYTLWKNITTIFKVKMSDFLKKTTVNEAWMSVVIWQLSHHSARFLMIIIVSIVSKLSLFGGTQKLMPSFAFNKLLLFYSIE